MAKHNIPPIFAGLTGIFQELYSRLESLERRPALGLERVDALTDTTLDPIARWVWANSSSPFSLVLPDPWDGATISIKNIGSATVTVTSPTGNIDGGASTTVTGGAALRTLQSDGTNWITL
jgi:hypothetical protein